MCHNHLKQSLKKLEKPETSPTNNTYLSIFFGPDVPHGFPGAYGGPRLKYPLGFQPPLKQCVIILTTIAYLRVLIIEIGEKPMILMVGKEAQGIRFHLPPPQKKQKNPRNAPSRSTHVPESWSLKQTSRGCRFPGEKTLARRTNVKTT